MRVLKAKYRLGDMTAGAFAQAVRDNPVVLLPLGSHEDHGPHLPMGDYALADMLAAQIAEAATLAGVQTYAAPCLPFGVADFFCSSPGGLALAPQSFRLVLGDMIAALLAHGLTKIVLLNGHGGNVPVIHEVSLKVKRETGIIIPSFYLWKIARQLMEKQLGAGHSARFGHGAEPLLSLSMALRGEDVLANALPPAAPAAAPAALLGLPVADFGMLDFQGFSVGAPVEFSEMPQTAIVSVWPLASAALGTQVAGALVELAVKFITHFAQAEAIK